MLNKYRVTIILPNGTVTQIVIEANSMLTAEQIGSAYGTVRTAVQI